MANVYFNAEARDQYDELPTPIQKRVLVVLRRLEEWPDVSGAKPLRGKLAGRFRIRTGDYRVQFCVLGDVVTVEKVGHRDGFYE